MGNFQGRSHCCGKQIYLKYSVAASSKGGVDA